MYKANQELFKDFKCMNIHFDYVSGKYNQF